jgi:selenocysteine lyase/cysteine desulfurase
MKPGDIVSTLMDKYQIITTPIVWENVSAVRVTPHIYTTTKDLDRFIDAVAKVAVS